tara:strand:+ start:936 stop:1568 length:633 start_codon:yes stop_codon:yes gene_type:complete
MDPIVLSNKFDEINKKFEKLEAENKILKNEINSLKKIIGTKMNSERIVKEKIFVSHKKHIEYISQNFIPEENISQFVKNISITREQLLNCLKNFETGICNILESIINEKIPIISFSFSRKNYLYLYDNNEWKNSSDKDITDIIKKIIIGPVFIEFTKWQNDNKELIKSDTLSTIIDHNTYHNVLMLIMNTTQNMLSDFKKHMISKIRTIN